MDPEKSSCCAGCDDNCQNIVALKIFDQCKIQECKTVGPVVSREHCACKILPLCDEGENPQRIILPGCPVTAPHSTACVEIMKNSFSLINTDIENICPSPFRKDYWCADILFSFEFTLQMLSVNMQPIKIVCCPAAMDEMQGQQKEKQWLKVGVSYRKQVMLYGGEKPPKQVFSNIFCGSGKFNDPYLLVQSDACAMSEALKAPCGLEAEPNKGQPSHDETCIPYYYIFVEIFLGGTVQLVRMVCHEISAKPCIEPKKYESCSEDPCKFFDQMKFPHELFLSNK